MSLSNLLRRLARHPWCVALCLLGTTLLSAWGAAQLRFDFAPQSLSAGRDDLLSFSEEFQDTFGHDDSVIQVILKAEDAENVLQPEALDWQVSLAHDLDRLPDVVRVESLGSITTRRFRLSGRLGIAREPLIQLPANSQTEARLQNFLDRTQLPEGTLVGMDRKVAAVLVFFDPELQTLEQMQNIVDHVQSTVRENPPPEGYKAYITGQSVLRVEIVRNLQEDQRSLIPLAGVLYFIALVLAYRRVSGSVVPLVAVGIGLAWTMGMVAFTGQSFNLISNVLPMLLMVLGISNSVHIISRYQEESQNSPNRPEAVVRTMRHMVLACLLTFLTTAAGFASLGTAHSDVLREFGWQAVFGLILLYFAIIITLTTALPWLRPPVAWRVGKLFGRSRWLDAFSFQVTQRPKLTLAASLLVLGFALFAARDVKRNSYIMETYEDSHPTMSAIRLVERKLSGVFPLELDLQVDDPEQFFQADFARKLAEVQRFAAQQEEVVFQRSYLNLHAELEPGIRPLLLENETSIPNLQTYLDRSQVRMRHAAGEMGYSAFLTEDKTRARLLMRIRDKGTHQTRQLIERFEAKLANTFEEDDGVSCRLTGDAYVITMAMDRLIHDLMISLLTASGVIFLIIAVLFRSFRVGLLTALPNATPLILTLGYMGWRGYDMNAGNVIVFTISLGIAVDDTIHLLFRFREEQQRQPNVVAATRAALRGTGPAMILTSILIVAGLSVLLLSQFVPTRRFAELLIVTMGGALIGDLLLLPACLVLFGSSEKSKTSTPRKVNDEDSRALETMDSLSETEELVAEGR